VRSIASRAPYIYIYAHAMNRVPSFEYGSSSFEYVKPSFEYGSSTSTEVRVSST
jgi:hypothetical protein